MVRFKNITELNWTYNLAFGSTGTQPVRIQSMHTSWMAPPGTNEVQEAIFNNYQHKKLAKYSWKIDNWRMFIETRTTLPAVGNAPPVTDISIVEAPNWVYWYWRQQTEANATPPAAGDESRYTKFLARHPKAAVWGKLPISYKRMNWFTGTYRTLFTPSASWANLDNYLKDMGQMTYDTTGTASAMPCADIWVMPDDPYPQTFYPNPNTNLVRTVQLHVVADMHTYASFKCMKPEIAPIAP